MDSLPDASDRRRFLSISLAGTLAALASGRASARVNPRQRALFEASRLGSLAGRRRMRESLRMRQSRALIQSRLPIPETRTSGDEDSLPDAIGSFTKTLPHDARGVVEPAAWQAMLDALDSGAEADLDAIPSGGPVKLANPEAAWAFSLFGADPHALGMPAAPGYASAQTAGEMVELYAHALLRDVPFEAYEQRRRGEGVADIISALNALGDFRGPKEAGEVTPRTLFRGNMPGCLDGNYISQFLLLPVPFGALPMDQRFRVTAVGDDHMTDAAGWLNILRGGAPTTTATHDDTPRYITTGRDLGEFVHVDFPFQAYLNAALILLGRGVPFHPSNPFNRYANRESFVTYGISEIVGRMGEVSQLALKTAWRQKWLVHRRLRPEVFGGRLHHKLEGNHDSPIHADLLDSVLPRLVHRRNRSWFLPMAYPEGSPTHPAYPAGHAVTAGACTTVLKAFFDGSAVLGDPVEVDPDSDATALRPYSGGDTLTVGGELNKLGNNIAIGRNIAGVHYRSDGHEGMLLGEKVAVAAMRDWIGLATPPAGPIRFEGFDGSTIEI